MDKLTIKWSGRLKPPGISTIKRRSPGRLFLNTSEYYFLPKWLWGVAVVTFLVMFKRPIQDYIDRMANLDFAGTKIATPQKDLVRAEQEATPRPPIEPDEEEVELPEGNHLTPEQAQKVADLFQAERATARL